MDRKSFYILCSLFSTLSFSVSATAALIPSIASYFGESALLAGKIVWIYMLPYGLFALFWGPLTRKFSTKKLLLVCLLLFSLASFIVGSAPRLFLTFIGRLGMGIFGSCFVPISLIIIGKEVSSRDKSKYVGFLFSLSFASSLLGVFLSGLLFWRFIYLIPSLLGIIVFIFSIYLLKDFDYRGNFRISYLATFRNKTVLRLFIFIFIGSFLYHSIQQWLGVYLSKEYQFSQFLISSVLTISSLIAIFSENMGGYFASRLGARNIASLGLISMSIFIIFLLTLKIPKLIFFLIAFWGLGWAFNHVGLSSLLTALPDKFLRDASSLNSSLRFFSGGLGAFYAGKIIPLLTFRTHFLITALLIFILGIVLRREVLLIEGGRHA